MRSIRARVLLAVLGVLLVSLTLLSVKGYLDARHETEELFDAQLARSARLISGLIGRELDADERASLQAALDEAIARGGLAGRGHRYETKLAFQLLDADGSVLLQSSSAPEGLVDALMRTAGVDDFEHFADGADELPGYHDVQVREHRWRVFALRGGEAHAPRWVLVGERGDVRGELVGSITLGSLIPDAVGLPLIALLVSLAIGWGLRPLQRMVTMIRARDPEHLEPLVLAPLPAELEPVVAALNRLLAQVDTVLAREKRFIADAAHELRTPLAVLRIHAQNAADAPVQSDRDQALRHLGIGVERATRIVAQLLTLARLEPDGGSLASGEVDLRGFVRGEVAELAPLALERDQDIDFEAAEDGDFTLVCDAPSIAILLQNLVGNAVQYAPRSGRIRVALEAGEQELRIVVEDSGPGVADALRSRLVERFFRAGEGAGAGLGLSIVQRIVELHGGRLALGRAPLGGLEVVVGLPRRPSR